MSTKTTFKRIALVAVAALSLGGIVGVSSASAAFDTSFNSADLYCVQGIVVNSSACTAYVNGYATVEFIQPAADTVTASVYNITVSGATITNAGATNTGAAYATGAFSNPMLSTNSFIGGGNKSALTFVNGTSLAGGVSLNTVDTTSGARHVAVQISSAVAGTATITVTKTTIATGKVSALETGSVSFAAASAAGVTTAGTKVYVVSTANSALGDGQYDCANVTSSNYNSVLGTDAKTSANYAGGQLGVCVITVDGYGNFTSASTLTASVTKGFIGTATGPTAPGVTTSSNGAKFLWLKGDSVNTGSTTISVTASDGVGGVGTVTNSTASFYGPAAKLTLTNSGYSSYYAKNTLFNAAGGIGAAAVGTGNPIFVTVSDSTGAIIPQTVWSTSSTATVGYGGLTTGSAANLLITSDNPTQAASTTKGHTNAWANVSLESAGDYGQSVSAASTTHVNYGSISVACDGVHAEKLTISLIGTAVDGTTTLTSNSVNYYCAGLAATVAVTPTDNSISAGSTTTVQVSLKDKNGYPAPDWGGYAETVSLAATGSGAIVPASALATSAGALATASTFVAGGSDSTAIVTAVESNNGLVGSAPISVTGGTADANGLSLDAANAATDAANNAYDEAQNATQAASDALAAVTALSAQVGALIATVKSLAAVVAKIKAKVKA